MSVTPARRNLTIWRGSSFAERFVYLETLSPRVAKDLTGYTAQVKVYYNDQMTTYSCSLEPTLGAINFQIAAPDTYTTWRGARYELFLTGAGHTDILLYGAIRSKGEIA